MFMGRDDVGNCHYIFSRDYNGICWERLNKTMKNRHLINRSPEIIFKFIYSLFNKQNIS